MRSHRFFFHRADRWAKGEHLLRWGHGAAWTIGHSYAGSFGFGASDSGKTSGMIRSQTAAVMEAGYGVLGLTTKETPSDTKFFKQIAGETGRESSVVLVGPGHGLGCNILRCEMEAAKDGDHHTDLSSNVAALMFNIGEGHGATPNDQSIWRPAGEALLRHVITAVYLATSDLRIDPIREAIASLPQSLREAGDATWQRESYCFDLLQKALALHPHDRNLNLAKDYLVHEFPTYPPDTRNSVVFTVRACGLDQFCREPLYSMFFSGTDYTPDILNDGAIIICDCPVLKFGDIGKIANSILRFATHRMLERRGEAADNRPVAIVWDECQTTLAKKDAAFQATARSTGCAVIAASQNLATLIDTVGDDLAHGFLGHFRTQIFFQNPEPATGEYMSARCGKVEERRTSTSHTPDGRTTRTVHKEWTEALAPHAAHNLKTGGEGDKYIVNGFLTVGGKKISKFLGLPYLRLKFHQLNLHPWFGSGCVSVVARRRPAPDFRYLRREKN